MLDITFVKDFIDEILDRLTTDREKLMEEANG